ncbi:MAG: Fe-S cluster domain-containing protein [Nitrospiraceae bacterium]|nr:Fe-S cluster domain-containing protein [Nitrospiraceae bacterium]
MLSHFHGIINVLGLIGEVIRAASSHNVVPLVEEGGKAAADAASSFHPVQIIKFTLIFLGGLGTLFGFGLAIAAQKFAVKVDPKVSQVRKALPGANCGACGFAGCQSYAEAVVANPDVSASLCAPGKESVAQQVAAITGKAAVVKEPEFARIMCQGGCSKAKKRYKYEGVQDCRAAILAGGGDKACRYGCLGYGTCEKVCPFGAITMTDDGLPFVDITKCTGCRKCEQACPVKVIEVLPASKEVLVACHSKDKGVETRKNCQVGCISCGMCEKVCPFEAASVSNNLAKIDINKCKVCGLCASKCPTGAIKDYIPQRPKAFVTDKCIGCTICQKVCPVDAASGELKQKHSIDQAKCIGCGICTEKCPAQAIDGTFNAPAVFQAAVAKKAAKSQNSMEAA